MTDKEQYTATEVSFEPGGRMATQNWQRVLVTGGRNFGWIEGDESEELHFAKMRERQFINDVLDEFYNQFHFAHLCHGDAIGVDKLCAKWARQHPDIRIHCYPANWEKFKQAAGPIRNKQMLERFNPDVVLAFPGGRGTENMKEIARHAAVRVVCPTP